MFRQCSFAAWIVLSGIAFPLFAHHGSTPHFDRDDPVSLHGVVTDLRFVNPHAFVYLNVIGDDGQTVQWRCELSGATTLGRLGWTADTLVPGQEIIIAGARARREEHSCLMDSITLADGSDIRNELVERFGVLPVASPDEVANRPRILANGQPNISGAWISRSGGGGGGERTNGPAEPSAAGRAASEHFDPRYDNPVIRCESGNIISDWYRQSQINDIQQFGDRIVLRYGYLDMERTIWLDIEHPPNITPSVTGHSIGWWEDDTLVVDTIGMSERALSPLSATMMSEQAHVTERFRYDAGSRTLYREVTVEDPLYLAKPYGVIHESDIASEPYRPFDCVDLSGENNRRPDSVD